MEKVPGEVLSPKAYLLHPEGYFDRTLGEALKVSVQEAIAGGYSNVIISFSRVTSINSLGVSGLLESFGLMEDIEGEIWLTEASPAHETILDTAGVLLLVNGIQSLDQIKAQL